VLKKVGLNSGKKKSTSHYKIDIENGFRKDWGENGKLTYQGNFFDGVEEIK
jgi:antitoxin component YwqK of YwqJK toxin-antitoxin module